MRSRYSLATIFSGSNAPALGPFFISSLSHFLKIGNKVLSYFERTKTTLYQPVMDIIQGEQRYQLIKLTLDTGDSIETTAEHSFYIKGKGWNPASFLKVGEALQLHNGTTVVIKEIETAVRVEKVYNLTVANTHNYFVGEDGVLVHNCLLSKIKEKFADYRDWWKKYRRGKKLAKEIMDAVGSYGEGESGLEGGSKTPGPYIPPPTNITRPK